MTENPAQRYRRLADRFDEVVSAVPADRWDAVSPCEGWTVADVVAHVADTELDFLERHDLTSGEAPGDPVERWRAARAAMQTAIDDPRVAERGFDGYFGPTTIEQTVDTFYAMDLAVHAWDVAAAQVCPSSRTSATTTSPTPERSWPSPATRSAWAGSSARRSR